MGVDYFSCANCGEAHSEYDQITCDKCESYLCSCAMPEELQKQCGCWEDIYLYITTDSEGNIVKARDCNEDDSEIFRKYLTVNEDYGVVLKEEYCPICTRRKKNSEDPEYQEYLRLKAKFEP
jgi:hypothetical protein